MMDLNVPKFGVILLSSSIFLTGCLQNQNGDASPPERDDPVEEPENNPDNPDDSDLPGTDDPDSQDPGLEDPDNGDPGLEDPGSEDPGGDTPISDGDSATPYANGTQLYGLLDAESGKPNIIREARNISGNAISYDVSQRTAEGGTWAAYDGALPSYILGDTGSNLDFIEMLTGSYDLDTNLYALLFANTQSVAFNIEHFFYDAAGQAVGDFVNVNIGLPTLFQFISPDVNFDASAFIYQEVLTNPSDLVVYYPGNNDGSNCRLANGNAISISINNTGNCNVIVDGSLNAVTSLSDATATDFGSAKTLRMSALLEDGIKLVARDASGGNIHAASDADSENNIGFYQVVDDLAVTYLELSINDIANQDYFIGEDLPWSGVTKLIIAEDNGYLRIGGLIPAQSTFESDTYLLNDAALDQLSESVNW